jgi:hypothetical protein
MSQAFRRYEILLPLRFNDGQPIPAKMIEESLLEVRQRFGDSCETQTTQGNWKHEGRLYSDELVRMYVDVPDSAENRAFFSQLKERLKDHFRQIEIWITTYPIELL